mmetsp:Transcript_16100/g.19558  ORF Transcript_16100/g.19558 Transcript_16100/m.19558 type:complete len:221 (-) Transcript_16100:78-740(-)
MRNKDDEFAAKRFAYEKREKGSNLDSLLANADEIVPNLYLGSENAAMDAEVLKQHGITDILVPAFTGRERLLHEGEFNYLIWPIQDIKGFPIIWSFPTFVSRIEEILDGGGKALIHCASGISRSASVVAAYLMKAKDLDENQAFHYMRHRRSIVSNAKFDDQLRLWGKLNFDLESDTIPGQSDEARIKLLDELNRTYSVKRIKSLYSVLCGETQSFWGAK